MFIITSNILPDLMRQLRTGEITYLEKEEIKDYNQKID